MLWFAILKFSALSFGALAAIRARFVPALVPLLVSAVATVVLPLIAWLRPGSWVGRAVVAAPWAPIIASVAAGGLATVLAFRLLDRLPAGSAREESTTPAAYALLANTLLDAAVLVVVILALTLTEL